MPVKVMDAEGPSDRASLRGQLKDCRIETLIVRGTIFQGEGLVESVRILDEIDEKFAMVLKLITPR